MSALAFIPARGGSKGISRKNLVPVAGQPLVARAVEAARGSAGIERVVVSTDDREIAEVAERWGAEVLLRPATLAEDRTPMLPVALHALDTLAARGYRPEVLVTLHPTSPFRSSSLIDRCLEEFRAGGADTVITVRAVNPRIGHLLDGFFQPKFDAEHPAPVYVDAGAVYVNSVGQLRETRSFVGRRARAVVVDRIEGLDLNTPLDLRIAECIAEHASVAPTGPGGHA